jgi:hypothetical protein
LNLREQNKTPRLQNSGAFINLLVCGNRCSWRMITILCLNYFRAISGLAVLHDGKAVSANIIVFLTGSVF